MESLRLVASSTSEEERYLTIVLADWAVVVDSSVEALMWSWEAG